MITDISPKQMLALTWWCDASKYKDMDAVICDGAVRSGKTLFLALSFIGKGHFHGFDLPVKGLRAVSGPVLHLLGNAEI